MYYGKIISLSPSLSLSLTLSLSLPARASDEKSALHESTLHYSLEIIEMVITCFSPVSGTCSI